MSAIVYAAVNRSNGDTYVGATTLSLDERRRTHESEARRGLSSRPFHHAIRIYGSDAFDWSVLSTHLTGASAAAAECDVIRKTNPVYNSGRPGAGRFDARNDGRAVVRLDDNVRYADAREAAFANGVSRSSIVQVCLRHQYRWRAGGYIFRYEDDNEGLESALARIAAARESIKRSTTNLSRPIKCIDDGRIFETLGDAAQAYGLAAAAIGDVCRGRYEHTGGMRFQFCGERAAPPRAPAIGVLPACAAGVQGETWKRMNGMEQHYAISSHGRICSLDRTVPHGTSGSVRRRGHLLRMSRDKDGYLFVTLRHAGNAAGRRVKVHTLVAETFIGPRPHGLLVLHGDGDNENNAISNLRYGTQKENIEDARRHGRLMSGERQWNAKLTEPAVRDILRRAGRVSQSDLGAEYGVKKTTIQKIVAGESWKHVGRDDGL